MFPGAEKTTLTGSKIACLLSRQAQATRRVNKADYIKLIVSLRPRIPGRARPDTTASWRDTRPHEGRGAFYRQARASPVSSQSVNLLGIALKCK